MSWPTPAEINEAVQNPQLSFHDPELAEGRAELDSLGIPLARSGSNADVYCFTCGTQRVAVKCFTRPIAHLERRYEQVHNVLRTLKLPFTVDCGYQTEGIWLQDQWYPLVRMQWVDGIRLNEFVQSALGRKEMLNALIQILARMGDWLEVNRLGHCDLQHGNILLIPSHGGRKLALRLVDYDGMWVPALDGDPPQEFGHPDYQHPARMSSGYYGPAADRFSLLAIATGLRGVMAHGSELWKKYDNTVNILFSQKDYQDPHRSSLIADLSRSKDNLVRRLCGELGEACGGPLDRVRPLSEILKGTTAARAYEEVPMAEAVEVLPLPEEELVPLPLDDAAPVFDFRPAQDVEDSGGGRVRSKSRREDEPSPSSRKWLWGVLPAGALLLGLLVLLGAGAFQKKQPADKEDGDKGGQKAAAPVPPKTDSKAIKKPETVEQKGQKEIDAFNRDPRAFLTGTTWQFRRNINGQYTPLGQFTLAADGRILGAKHPNETSWTVDGAFLLFRNRQGQTMTTFLRAELQGRQMVLVGMFNGAPIHELVRDVE
jgi:hypothetical protein